LSLDWQMNLFEMFLVFFTVGVVCIVMSVHRGRLTRITQFLLITLAEKPLTSSSELEVYHILVNFGQNFVHVVFFTVCVTPSEIRACYLSSLSNTFYLKYSVSLLLEYLKRISVKRYAFRRSDHPALSARVFCGDEA